MVGIKPAAINLLLVKCKNSIPRSLRCLHPFPLSLSYSQLTNLRVLKTVEEPSAPFPRSCRENCLSWLYQYCCICVVPCAYRFLQHRCCGVDTPIWLWIGVGTPNWLWIGVGTCGVLRWGYWWNLLARLRVGRRSGARNLLFMWVSTLHLEFCKGEFGG
jgi:hypothetical protein